MSLTEYAKKELELAELLSKDSDYDGMIGESVLELVDIFSQQGHSGNSARQTMTIFQKVAMFQPLKPLTYEPDEWNDISEHCGKLMWQNKRDSRIFSVDCGRTHYNVDEIKKGVNPAKAEKVLTKDEATTISRVIVDEAALDEGDTLVTLNSEGKIKDFHFGKGAQPDCIAKMVAENGNVAYVRKNPKEESR